MTGITAKLAEALERVLTWPLPQGTVESYSLPPWLSADAREALADFREHTEAQAGGTEGFDAWFDEYRRRTWHEMGCDKDRGPDPTEHWAMGHKAHMLEAWNARAALAAAPAAAQGAENGCIRLPPLPKGLEMEERSVTAAIRAYAADAFERGRQQGMSQAKGEMAKAEQAVPVAWSLHLESSVHPAIISLTSPDGVKWYFSEGDGRDARMKQMGTHIFSFLSAFQSTRVSTERRPLTEDQVEALWKRWYLRPADEAWMATPDYKRIQIAYQDGIADAQRAHGITAGTTEQAKEQKT